MDFEYSAECIPGPGCPSSWFEEELQGCSCEDQCTSTSGCSCLLGAEDNYSSEKIYEEKLSGAPVIECGENCRCLSNCANRMLQHGITLKLEVFVHQNGKGFGVRAAELIKRGSFVCQYAGEIIGKEEVELRATTRRFHNYVFTVKEHCNGDTNFTYIDPKYRGNLARFINHSCEPNLLIVPVRVSRPVPLIGLFASRDIDIGEELSYDYGLPEQMNNLKKCLCGTASCRGYLPTTITASE
ncbi:unnamed protein product [Auanema sp. JU1783]|nr:unnamed protein product [Auanema sp. JU1783]